jgi:transcriptional regulator with AAA-type ATPase domain
VASIAGEFALRIWPPLSREPLSPSTVFARELALDRELLAVQDGSVSRTANAPKLRPASLTGLELDVPERSARPVLVLEGMRFENLQQAVPPADSEWKIGPGQLGRPARVARNTTASLALVRQLAWDRPGPTHHLLLLPPSRLIRPGESALIAAPAILVIGEAAVDVTPSDTLIPAVTPGGGERCISFRLADVEQALDPLDRLDGFPLQETLGRLRAPDWEADQLLADLPATALEYLDQALRDHLFFPLLEGDRRARLALGYRRADGTGGVLVSGSPEAFIAELALFVRGGSPRAAASIAPPAPRTRSSAQPPPEVHARFGSVETKSALFAAVLEQLVHVAPTELSILFLGQSGTGKEYLATAVHGASPRAQGPFVPINCSALSDDLIESELFGHKKGAFTGAHGDRAGAFVSAHGGTLLLDEIGDAPARVQLALLRALETRQVRAVGSDVDRGVDVRVLAATSRDLKALIADGVFRQDLYYRLAEASVDLPPLRERPEDLPILVEGILATLGPGLTLTSEAQKLLLTHDWPGNVRELRNALKRAVALSRGGPVLQAVHLLPLGDQPLQTQAPPALPKARVPFPPHVAALADQAWRAGTLPARGDATKYEARALHRAALLCLLKRAPLNAWPKGLASDWRRLFRETWATAEEGRGLREVLRELRVEAGDAEVVERILGMVGRGAG